MSIDEILASLERRGFYGGIDRNMAGTQVYAVIEELGEVARMLRRADQGVASLEHTKLAIEAADVVIAAVCLLGQVAGSTSAGLLRAKCQADEMRGYRHGGAA